jgi:hypothetical protein
MSDKRNRNTYSAGHDSDDLLSFDLSNDDDHMAYIDAIFADHEKEQARKSRKSSGNRGRAQSKGRSSKSR